jgi:hypothetical protein
MTTRIPDTTTTSRGFDRFAGGAAVVAAVGGLAYAVAFVVLKTTLLASVFLLLDGLAATPVLVALYSRLRLVEPGFAGWAAVLTLAGALGSVVHAGGDLANALAAPASAVGADLPNAVDPRGLLTFGATGIGIVVVGVLIARSTTFPRGLAYLACLNGLLLLALYLGRLIVLDPASPWILLPAALTGFLVNPVFYAWLGIVLLRARPA